MAARPQETELDKIVYMMEFSQELCTRTQVYRQNLAWGHKKKVKTMKITRFPAFTLSENTRSLSACTIIFFFFYGVDTKIDCKFVSFFWDMQEM